MSKIALSISLVKEGVLEENILKNANTLSCQIGDVGMLYYVNSARKDARKIKDFFGATLPEGNDGGQVPILYTANVQAVLVIKRLIDNVQRVFVVTFGLGRNLVNVDCLQDKFGMYVVLNSISPSTVRSVDINILEAVPKHDRIQSTKLSKINTFNLNSERDLLRAVTGKTKRELVDKLGETVTGADSLKVSLDITVNNLPDKLEEIYRIYKLQVYKDNFAFIDLITPIKDSVLSETLNTELIRRINSQEFDLVWMSIPELFNWEELGTIRYTPGGSDYFDFDIRTLVNDVYFGESLTKSMLNNKNVLAYSTTGVKLRTWSVYRCLCAEVSDGGKQYILSNGQWYLIDETFSNDVENFYNHEIGLSDLQLEEAKLNEKEEDYNNRIAALDNEHRLMMDRQLIQHVSGPDKIELCDIYTSNKEFVHVKRYTGSATLSHLFNQGLVSGELLVRKGFREKLNTKIDALANGSEHRDLSAWKIVGDFHRDDYKIIFAIITDCEEDKPSIPFFSKVALRNVCSRLKEYGYNVSLMKIGINRNEDANPELTLKRNSRVQKEKDRRNRNQN